MRGLEEEHLKGIPVDRICLQGGPGQSLGWGLGEPWDRLGGSLADFGKRRFEPPRGAEKKISRPIEEKSEAHDETMGEAGAGAGRVSRDEAVERRTVQTTNISFNG